jgi:hypothetical protein
MTPLDAQSTPPISPAGTAIPQTGSLAAAASAMIKTGAQKYVLFVVTLFAMGFVVLAAFLGAGMPPVRHTVSEAKIAAASTQLVNIRPALLKQGEQLRPPVKHHGYQEMSLRDFVLDEKRLIGRKVRVTGLYQQMEDITLLAASGEDMNPIDLDVTKLTRKERSALLDCPNRDCVFQVEGRVRMSRSGVIVRADNVLEVREN